MTHAEDAEHDAPLNLGDTLEIAFRVFRNGHDHGQREEKVRRDEERHEVGDVETDERVLHGNGYVERDDERIVIRGLCGRDGNELSQQKEADECEEDKQRGLAKCERDREDDDEPPGHAHASVDCQKTGSLFWIAAAVQSPVRVESAGCGKKR